jgi:hypothetical protein
MNEYRQPGLIRGEPSRLFVVFEDLTREIVLTHAHTDSLSSTHGPTRAPRTPFRTFCPLQKRVTFFPFPTGRKFSKKIFIFFPAGRILAQI